MAQPWRDLWRAVGPGVLFTGAAVGVSHLVQSTRAGATYGLSLIGIILVANVLKYPAFRFGPQYAAATGTSLLEGYRRQGKWALWLYLLLTLSTMFTVQAAVTVVTAGLLNYLLGIALSPVLVSAALIAVCATLLALGRYHWLDRIAKVVVSVLALSTVLATALALPAMDFGALRLWPAPGALSDLKTVAFVVALAGWMPSAIDVAVWQSLWTLARARDSHHVPTLRQSMVDFHLGYFGTVLLSVCFLALGTAVMFGTGVALASSPAGFAGQLVDLYASTLGGWSRPVIAICAFFTMFSTTLTVVDGFPRALAGLVARMGSEERPEAYEAEEARTRLAYWTALIVLAVGAVALLWLLLTSLPVMVDLATTLSFLTAPLLAWLNHRAVTGPEVPPDRQPGRRLRALSWAGIVALGAFALYYLSLQVSGG